MVTAKRIRVVWVTNTSDTYLSTFWFDGGDTAAAAASAVTTFCNAIKTKISTSISGSLDPSCYDIDITTGKPTAVTPVSGTIGGGTDAGEVLPYATQGLLRLRSGVFINGREVRGRLFLPAPTEASNSAGFPLSAYQTAIDTAAAALIADTPTHWSLWSRAHQAVTGITSATTKNNWAVLTSRRDT